MKSEARHETSRASDCLARRAEMFWAIGRRWPQAQWPHLAACKQQVIAFAAVVVVAGKQTNCNVLHARRP